jgi:hypothetical protein
VHRIVNGAEGFVGSALPGKDQVLHQRGASDVAHGFQRFLFNLVETQLVVFAPRHQLELTVVYPFVGHASPASPEELLGLVAAMSGKDGDRLDCAIHGSFGVGALVVEEQVAWLCLRHGQQAVAKGRMSSAPYREIGTNDSLRRLVILGIVPELDAPI